MHLTFRNELYRVFTHLFQTAGVDGLPISVLAKALKLSKQVVKRNLEQLEKAGLIFPTFPPVVRVMNQSGLYVAQPAEQLWRVVLRYARSFIGATLRFDAVFPVISATTGDVVIPLAFFIFRRSMIAEEARRLLLTAGIKQAAGPLHLSAAGYRLQLENIARSDYLRAISVLGTYQNDYVTYPPTDVESPRIDPVTPVARPVNVASVHDVSNADVSGLLDQLRAATDPSVKRKLRAKLRAKGHRGGLG